MKAWLASRQNSQPAEPFRNTPKNITSPLHPRYRERADKDSALGTELLKWRYKIAREWNSVRFGPLQIETHDGQHFFRVQLLPGNLPLSDLKVELYADPLSGRRLSR